MKPPKACYDDCKPRLLFKYGELEVADLRFIEHEWHLELKDDCGAMMLTRKQLRAIMPTLEGWLNKTLDVTGLSKTKKEES